MSNPHLAGSSRSPSLSPTTTEPYPGPGIDGIPTIPDEGSGSGIGVGLLFDAGSASGIPESGSRKANHKGKHRERATKAKVPNPYAPSSSTSEEEADVAPKPLSERAKKGWIAHQSIFPASSSESESESSSEDDKITELDSEDAQSVMMGRSRINERRASKGRSPKGLGAEEDDPDGYLLSPSERYKASETVQDDLQQPLLGPGDLQQGGGSPARIPVRLQVYHGRFGHWEREGLRKYKGPSSLFIIVMVLKVICTDSGYLALWLTSLIGVVIGLGFVWGSTDVRSRI